MATFREIFERGTPQISFEFFPPKRTDDLPGTRALMESLAARTPAFMTVTYGAGGGTRELTRDLVSFIARELKTPSVAHLTCVGHSAAEIDQILDSLHSGGVDMVLALRGDPPKDQSSFAPTPGGFRCARDLARHIHDRGGFSVAVAGYPETHPEAGSAAADIAYLREKQDAGAEVVITQLFFDPALYFSFVDQAREAGITIPIIPGIIPIGNVAQIERFTKMCGATIPAPLSAALNAIRNDAEAVHEYGVQQATEMCRALLAGGAPGLHFYTLNRSTQVEEILNRLGY